jgi:hypothetical protein
VARFADRANSNSSAGFKVAGLDAQIMAFDIVPKATPRVALTSMPRDGDTEESLVLTVRPSHSIT